MAEVEDARSAPRALFARANEARRRGRVTEALGLYQRLQATYPNSAEARHANLTVAELELGRGNASRALQKSTLRFSSFGKTS